MIIYLGGSISGKTYEETVANINDRKYRLQLMGYEVLNPMTAKKAIRNEVTLKSHGYGNPESTNHAIYGRDKSMVVRSDVLFFDLRGTKERASQGSCFEMAWGSFLNKHIVLVMEQDSIHQHAFVLEAADIIFDNIEDAYSYLEVFAKME